MDKKKLRHSTATYIEGEHPKTDLVELAQIYRSISRIPERIGFTRACEIQLLASAFLRMHRKMGVMGE